MSKSEPTVILDSEAVWCYTVHERRLYCRRRVIRMMRLLCLEVNMTTEEEKQSKQILYWTVGVTGIVVIALLVYAFVAGWI